MSKHKFPDRLNWPDQSAFSSEDRNAVWNKIKRGEKKRAAKWLPYSLSAVAAAAAIFLIVHITGVEEQAPVDQPEEEVEGIEEAVEPVEDSESESGIDLRQLNEGDEINGWIVSEVYSDRVSSGVVFKKSVEITGALYNKTIDGENNVLLRPEEIAEDIFPFDLSEQDIMLAGSGPFSQSLYGLKGQTSAQMTFSSESLMISFNPDERFSIMSVTLFPEFGPPLTSIDPNAIDENIYFSTLSEYDGFDQEDVEMSRRNMERHQSDDELEGLSPVNIIRIMNGMAEKDHHLFFRDLSDFESEAEYEELIETTNILLEEFGQDELIEVIYSENIAYITGTLNDGGPLRRISFTREDHNWKITPMSFIRDNYLE